MIDSHCHLYVEDFQQDIKEVILRAGEKGVKKFFMPAIDSTTHNAMISLEEQFKGTCYAMIGLHPCSVKENYLQELAEVEGWLKKRPFAAIGEAGLDFYWDTSFKKEQYLALERQAALALQYDLPLILHTRNAMQETIDVIKNYHGRGLRGIFHCFGGSLTEAEQIVEINFLLGIGGVVTYKKAGLDLVLPSIGLQHLVLETDAPYLSPVPYRGKRNESAYLMEIANKIASVMNIPREEVMKITTANAERLFYKSL